MQNYNSKIKISAIIIAKNAGEMIEDCLRSVSFCNEIIVVDGGSTDQTISLAKKYHARIITVTDTNFAEQRDKGLHEAKGDWVFYIDTDERITPELREEIINHTHETVNKYVAFKVLRENFYFGNHQWPTIERLERLFQRASLKGWHGKLHESPILKGEVGELKGFLLHYTHRDLTSMLEKTIEWSKIEAELRLSHNHPQMTWWRFPRVMLTAFYDSYIKQKGYKAGTTGIVESMYQAFSIFITYARLWEMQQKVKNQNAKGKITT